MMYRLLFAALALVLSCHVNAQLTYDAELEAILPQEVCFPFGVASGDPTQHSMVLWTALHPSFGARGEAVLGEISTSASFAHVLHTFTTQAQADNGYTLSVPVEHLAPDTRYYYRFRCGEHTSEVGITHTLPQNPDEIVFAVVSCSNYEWGYFNAYASIAHTEGLDFVIHLGDYIYEYESGKYGSKKLPRKHLPKKELIGLADYRTRYAHYRLDPHLKELHRTMPIIAVWDDHEIANNAYREGAENHQPADGSWQQRVEAARKAYFEWMPITPQATPSIQRSFNWGNLASLWMLDGRLEGRSKQLASLNDPQAADTARTMLGHEQRDRLLKEVGESTARWKVLGNQVVFSSFELPAALDRYGKSMDMWEGYSVERKYLMSRWQAAGVNNIVVLTGDAHASFCMDLRADRLDPRTHMGAEWVTPSVTSGSLNEYIATWKVHIAERKLANKKLNPHLRYVNFRDHGYMIVRLNQQEANCTWYFERNILKPKPRAKKGYSHRVKATVPFSGS
jgi:alkaline phosphatase D